MARELASGSHLAHEVQWARAYAFRMQALLTPATMPAKKKARTVDQAVHKRSGSAQRR